MRIAVISDIHADLAALGRVLAAIDREPPEEIWCLGDIVGLGGDAPAAVVELVRERSALVLAGNHDRWVTGDLTLDMLPLPGQRKELEWQRSQLSVEQVGWLGNLPTYARRAGVELWHGSAEDPLTGWISSEADAARHLAIQESSFGIVGHTHRPLFASLAAGGLRYDEDPQKEGLRSRDRTLLNPGAVAHTHRWLEFDQSVGLASWRLA